LTGALASSGNAHLVTKQIWAEEVNARGGLLGRPVQLIYYDDQTNVSTIPGIYTKLIDVDKVDILMGAATNLIVAAMPIIVQRKRLVMSLVALAINDEFKYPGYFHSAPFGPEAKLVHAQNFFETAKLLSPKPQTVAFVGADAEFSSNAIKGARSLAPKYGMKVVFDRTYPPATTDFGPIMRPLAATNPDLVFVASYPIDSVGVVRAARELGLKTRMFGGAMVGLQYAGIRAQLADQLNGIVNYEFWAPTPKMKFPGIEDLVKKYQARAKPKGLDALGYYQPPFAYAGMQVLEQAITATNTLDNAKLIDYIHKTKFKTIVGDFSFDSSGEWSEARVLMVQFQNVKGAGLEQYEKEGAVAVVYPPQFTDGSLQPFSK
ncbi:MAG: amino acid ABC transporter substrate-binding protein, partial [Variibacter sp.]|nr:amino acid ABC transporter substrate-binding protein [Variibacter sp.]